MIEFEWDPLKARVNRRKHGVAFGEAATVFRDSFAITFHDPDHSESEDRFITIGTSAAGRLLMVAHTERDERVRVISARPLTPVERRTYEGEIERRKS